MEQKSSDSNNSSFELNIRLKLKSDAKLGFKKSWILTIALALIQVVVSRIGILL